MIKARYQKMYTEKHKQDMDFVIIGDNYIGPFVDMDVAQKAVNAINSQFMPQPKRTRTEYEKVTESIFDLRDEFECGDLYCKNLCASDDYTRLNTEVALFGCAAAGNIYRQVEIDWRDEVVKSLPAGYGVEAFGSKDIRVKGVFDKEQVLILANAIIASLTENQLISPKP